MLANSAQHGFKPALMTAVGDLSANFLQMLVAAMGLASVILQSQPMFLVIQWAGVLYLLYLGIRLICTKPPAPSSKELPKPLRYLFWQGFITSAANPKAVVFFAALFPQFIDTQAALLPQFSILSITYLCIDGLFLCCYGIGAATIGQSLTSAKRFRLNKISGAFLITAAILLGLKSIDTT